MREEGDRSNTGSPVGGAHAPTGKPRGSAWAGGVAERLGVPEMPGNAGGGKGPQFERGAARRQGHEDWWKPNSSGKRSETPDGATCESEGISRLSILFAERQGVTGAVRLSGGVQRAGRSEARAPAAEHRPPGGGRRGSVQLLRRDTARGTDAQRGPPCERRAAAGLDQGVVGDAGGRGRRQGWHTPHEPSATGEEGDAARRAVNTTNDVAYGGFDIVGVVPRTVLRPSYGQGFRGSSPSESS